MRNNELLLLVIFIPLIGSFLLPLAGRISYFLRNILSLCFVSASLICSILLAPSVLSGEITTISLSLPLNLNFVLTADMLAVFMAIVSSLIGAVIVFYSFEYIKHYDNQNEYYFMVVLFLGSMMGIVFSANLIFLYVFWEITAIASWRLIGFFREKYIVLRADKSFLVTAFGAFMMLLGFLMIFQQAGSFDLAAIKMNLNNNPISDIAVILILFGIFSKSASLPLHTWLPDAGVAPSPVTALLHAAVLVKIGVYVYARLFISTFTVTEIWHTVVPAAAAVSALVSAGAAMIDTDLKRIIAYSTISQIGFIFLGLSTGNEIGITGGLLYIFMHGLAKGGLFLCAGIIEHNTKTKDITKLGGLISTMPITAVCFILCAFSVMGIPPFGGFFSKYMVITGAVVNGQFMIAFTFLAGAFLTIIYLLRVFSMVFLGEPKTVYPKEHSPIMISSVALLAVMSIASGIYINYISGPVQLTVQQMLGMVK